jgi:hypothetical protein
MMPGHHMPAADSGMPPDTRLEDVARERRQMMPTRGDVPALPGQDAFGALQEIVRILEADPHTDRSKVNMDGLREHLIDMNEVTLHTDAAIRRIDGGIEVAVTGAGRTLAAIERMIPDQARHLDATHDWHVTSQPLSSTFRIFGGGTAMG